MKRENNAAVHGRGKTVLVIVCLIVGFAFVLYSTIKIDSERKRVYLWIEAESVDHLEEPMEIGEGKRASEGRYLEIKEKMGTGMLGAKGRAGYDIRIPEPGTYAFWARTYWLDGCSNSFFVKIRDNYYHFGEDANFNVWHWVRLMLPPFERSDVVPLDIVNREDGIKIDKFLITNDLDFTPHGYGGGFYLFDFDDGNATGWMPGAKHGWEIRDGGGLDGSPAYFMLPLQSPPAEHAILGIETPVDFVFRCIAVSVHEIPNKQSIQLILCYRDQDNYLLVDYGDGLLTAEAVEHGSHRLLKQVVARGAPPSGSGKAYHYFEIEKNAEKVRIKFDGVPSIELTDDTFPDGYVGIGSRHGSVFFDDIVLSGSGEIQFSDNFYYDVITPPDVITGWQPIEGTWMKSISTGTVSYEVEAEGLALALSGERFWSNYSFDVCARGDGESGIGMLFYYSDSDNAYLFRWGGAESSGRYAGKKQLLRIVDGEASLLAEQEGGYARDQWYRIKIAVSDGNITTSIDNDMIFDVVDRSLFQGKIGLWADGSPAGDPSEPRIRFWPGSYTGDYWRQRFVFQVEGRNQLYRILFCYQNAQNFYVFRRSRISDGSGGCEIQLVQVIDGIETILDRRDDILTYPNTYSIDISRYKGIINLSVEKPVQIEIGDIKSVEKLKMEISSPVFVGGRLGLDLGRRASAVFDDISVDRVHVFQGGFSTNSNDESMYWDYFRSMEKIDDEIICSTPGSLSVALAGSEEWSNYEFRAKLYQESTRSGTAGVYYHYQNRDDYYLLECDYSSNRISLVKVRRHQREVLDSWRGCFAAGRWSDIRVLCVNGLMVASIDGNRVLETFDDEFDGGMVGLFAETDDVHYFGDVHVDFGKERRPLETVRNIFFDHTEESGPERGIEGWRVESGRFAVKNGALSVSDTGGGAYLISENEHVKGDVSVYMTVWTDSVSKPDIGIVIHNDGVDGESGYSMHMNNSGVELRRNGSVVASMEARVLEGGTAYRLKLEKRSNYVLGYIDGACIVRYREKKSLSGGVVMLVVENGFAYIDNVNVSRYPDYYYDFNLARWAARDFSAWHVLSGVWDERSSVTYSLYGEKDSEQDAIVRFKNTIPDSVAVELLYSNMKYNADCSFFVSFSDSDSSAYDGYLLHIAYGGTHTGRDGGGEVTLMKQGIAIETGVLRASDAYEWRKIRIEKNRGIKVYDGNVLVLETRDGDCVDGNTLFLGVTGGMAAPVFFDFIAIYGL